ncbi:hypothetical protein MBLNU230_g5860t1 [Neophaeotheca triangularis]
MAATTRASSPAHLQPLEGAPQTHPSTQGFSKDSDRLKPTSRSVTSNTGATAKPALLPTYTPPNLTGAGAMAEIRRRRQQEEAHQGRQTSPNPAMEAMQWLIGGGMSKPTDRPSPNKVSEPMGQVVEKMNMPPNGQSGSVQTSPMSMSSFGSAESTGAGGSMTATASAQRQMVEEPTDYRQSGDATSLMPPGDQDANKAFSYPGPPPSETNQDGGVSRGMSLPGYGRSSPKSPPTSGNKRHKCPYCSTDFTRHHNLKSHLLTHSQEKPYVCQTCQARFRRLHDLKRHTKLHTGERPHTCDKCGRRFARGDALARHSKGPGGCAGRRSSFGADDEYGDGMDGVEYDDEDDVGGDQEGRRGSEPSRKRTQLETPQDASRDVYRQHSSTYPPVRSQVMRGNAGNMAPPQVVHQGPSTDTSRDASGQPSPGGGSSMGSNCYASGAPGQVFSQQGVMTESPGPLSPSAPVDQHRLSTSDPAGSSGVHRNRSPSLTTQFQQAHFGRGSGRGTPPSTQFPPSHSSKGAPQLPILPGLGNNQVQGPRSGMQPASSSYPGGGQSHGPSLLQHQQLPPQTPQTGPSGGGGGSGSSHHTHPPTTSSQPGSSLSSHGHSSGSSMRDIVASSGSDPTTDLWNYVRTLDSRFSRMQDEYELRIGRLSEEVISLRTQLANATANNQQQVSGNAHVNSNPVAPVGPVGNYSNDVPQPRY